MGDWIERAAFLYMAARFGWQAVRFWRADEESEALGLLGLAAGSVILAWKVPPWIGGPVGIVLTCLTVAIAVIPDRALTRLLGVDYEKIGPHAQENDKQLTD